MTKLEDLYPSKKYKIIDLVKEAGADVSDWRNCKGGAKGASKNPKYCYEWSFIEKDKVVVLSLWHVDFETEGKSIIYKTNERKFANKKGRKSQWRTRALRMDNAFQYACSNGVPIKVIICAGAYIDGTKTSQVTRRVLDSEEWAITKYDDSTGECVIKRGVTQKKILTRSLSEYMPELQEKICKICWNDNGWQTPSGTLNKSKDKDSYENQFGFGHEEWLFDLDKLVDGYHYAFLQPISKGRNKYTGHSYTAYLYSVASRRASEYFWIAKIENLEVIDRKLEQKIIALYKENGWLTQMETDLNNCGADVKIFRNEVKNKMLFNVRFRPQDVQFFGAYPVMFSNDDLTKITNKRYRLIDKKGEVSLLRKPGELCYTGKSKKDKHSGKRSTRSSGSTQCRQLHTDIQNTLCEYLVSKYPEDIVDIETGSGMGTNIDIVLKRQKSKPVFFEVKTYPSAKLSIREALGQLLEYAYYPDRVMAKELVIVTHAKISKHDEDYLALLNTKLSIPIGYMQFDYKSAKPIYTYNCKIK